MADLRQNTWTLNQWYDQDVAGNADYTGTSGLFLWGHNNFGSLGQNDTVSRSSPVQVPGTTWKELTLSATYGGGLATKTDGTLWVWGHASYGSWPGLNQPSNSHLSSPTQIGTDTDWASPRGGGGSAAIKTDGTLWVWGGAFSGALGNNTSWPGGPAVRYSSPLQIPGTWSTATGKFSTGATTMGGIKPDGTMWTWGRGDIGQLGINKNSERSSPTQVGTGTDWDAIEMGFYFGLAKKTDGTLWGFGMNSSGQLGQNTTQSPGNHGLSSPVQIPGTNWARIITDYGASIAATKTDGTLWTWGAGGALLGQNNTVSYSSPTQVGTGDDWPTDKSMGMLVNALAINEGQNLFGWGANNYGQLGLNSKTVYSSPIQIPGSWSGNATCGGYNADQRTSAAMKIL